MLPQEVAYGVGGVEPPTCSDCGCRVVSRTDEVRLSRAICHLRVGILAKDQKLARLTARQYMPSLQEIKQIFAFLLKPRDSPRFGLDFGPSGLSLSGSSLELNDLGLNLGRFSLDLMDGDLDSISLGLDCSWLSLDLGDFGRD